MSYGSSIAAYYESLLSYFHLSPRWEQSNLPDHSWSKFMESKRKELQRLNNAYKNTLASAKVTFMEGHGKIVGPHEVEVSCFGYHLLDGKQTLIPFF